MIFFIAYSLYRNFFYDFSCLSASAHKSIYAISEFSFALVGLGSISVFFCPSCLPPAYAGQMVPLAIGWGLLLVCGCKINTLFNKNLRGGKIMLTIILFCKIQYFQCKFKSHKSIFHGIRAVFLQQIRGVAGVIADCPAVCLLAARPLAGRQGKAKAGRRHGQRIRRSALEAAIKTKEGGIKQFLDNLLIQSELQQHPTLQGKTARIAARNSPFQAAERAVSAASSASHRLEPGRTED